jgi:hypothetical protein
VLATWWKGGEPLNESGLPKTEFIQMSMCFPLFSSDHENIITYYLDNVLELVYLTLLTAGFSLGALWPDATRISREAQTMYAVAQEEMPLYHMRARKSMQMPSGE